MIKNRKFIKANQKNKPNNVHKQLQKTRIDQEKLKSFSNKLLKM